MKKIAEIFDIKIFLYAFVIWLSLNISGIQNLYFSTDITTITIIVKALHLIFLYIILKKLNLLWVNRKNPKVKNEIKISIIYFLILSILIILVWPGAWSNDDITILRNAEKYKLTPWHHFFSGLFQSLCLQTIPIPAGVIIIQALISSLIIGYCISNIAALYGKDKKQNIIIQIVLGLISLFPPLILYILSGFRMGMYSYFELLLITKMIILYKERNKLVFTELLKISLLTIIIACWRTEAIYYPVFILILYLILGRKVILKRVAITSFIIVMAINFSIGKINNNMIGSNNYSVTATIQGVIALVQHADETKDKKELDQIDKVMDVKHIKEHPNVPSEIIYWSDGVVKKYSDEEYSNYLKSYMKLTLKYPDVAFKSMWELFADSVSGMGDGSKQSLYNMVYNAHSTALQIYKIGTQGWREWSAVTSTVLRYNTAINEDIRENVILFLNGTQTDGSLTIIHNVFWNLFIPIILILISLIYKLIKKDWFMVVLILAIIARIPLVFATAPAPYFMYYLSTYLCSYVVSTIVIFEMINNKKDNNTEKIFNIKTFLYTFFIWFNINISGIHNKYFSEDKNEMTMLIKILHFVFLYIILAKLQSLCNKKHVKKIKNEILISVIYFIILLSLVFLVWPGIWGGEDITTLKNVSTYEFIQGQHFFSGVFQMLCLETIPIPAGVMIVQALIASLIVGYCISNISTLYGKNKKQVIIIQSALGVFTLLPPFLLYILSGLEVGIYAYLLLALITELLILYKEQKQATLHDIIKISFLTVILSCWRLEGICLPVLILLLYFIMGNKVIRKKTAIISFLIIMLINCLFGVINYLIVGSVSTSMYDTLKSLELYSIGTPTWIKWNTVTSTVKTPINLEVRNNVIKFLSRFDVNPIYICLGVIAFIVIWEITINVINKKTKGNANKEDKELIVYNRIFKQFLSFLLVSGVGWIIDFSIYIALTKLANFKVIYANILSSIPAITYVFLMSNKKIFKNMNSKLSLKIKYLIYFGYQLILLLSISLLGEFLYDKLIGFVIIPVLVNNFKIIIKILITPITMTLNFIFMKNLIEKL